jgi:hypothetical protein
LVRGRGDAVPFFMRGQGQRVRMGLNQVRWGIDTDLLQEHVSYPRGLTMAEGLFFARPHLFLSLELPQFFFAQLKYRGGEWDPNPQFVEAMVEELETRTSIDAMTERRVAALSDPDLFFFPFLYMAGKYGFDPFTPQEREILKRYLTYGGFLFAEDTMGAKGFGFDRAFRAEMKQIFPNQS